MGGRRSWLSGLRKVGLTASGKVGLALAVAALAVAFFGPFFAPHAPTAILGLPYSPPTQHYVLGLDYLGRDALSRFLWGGRTAVTLAFLGTGLGAVIAIITGVGAAVARGWVEAVFNRTTEVALAFPALILILLLVVGLGRSYVVIVLAVALANAPRMARIARGATLGVRDAEFIEVAAARGESRAHIIFRELLPNVAAPIAVDVGYRMTQSIVLVASISFLGLGIKPPAADWGLMISENRGGLTIQPWVVAAPIAAIAVLTVGVNLFIDGVRRSTRLSMPVETIEFQR